MVVGRIGALRLGMAVIVGWIGALSVRVAVLVGRLRLRVAVVVSGGGCGRRGRLGAQPQRHIDGRLVVHHLVTQRHAVVAPRHQHLRGVHDRVLARQYRREAVDGADKLLQPRHGGRVDTVRLVE